MSCGACPHASEAHDRIGVRYCSATMARGLDRECACASPADHENTYYR
ncbi:RGCVC family protein [Nocardia sp. SYP-A9097]